MFEKQCTKAVKLSRVVELAEQSVSADEDFQRDAKEDFNFRDGEQWPREEKAALADNKRPCLTFNLTKSSIDLIMGLNEDQKVRYRVTPVHKNDRILADVLNKVLYRLYEEGEWELEEDDAFESMAISGRGWIGVDFRHDPKRFGNVLIEETSIPVHEVFKDAASRRKDLGDASYILWERWMTAEDFMIKYPKSKIDLEDAFNTGFVWRDPSPKTEAQITYDEDFGDLDEASDYENPLDLSWYDKSRRMVRVIHMEYWRTYTRHFVRNPETNEVEEVQMGWGKFKKWFRETFPGREMHHTPVQDKKVHWIQFIRDEILYDDVSPLPYDGFSLVPCFAFTDISKRTQNTFGIVRLMKDAQREINKRWSQTLNLLNNQVQPGVFAEADAFVNRDQAEAAMKIPGDVAYLSPGAIQKQMIKERTVPSFPNAAFALEEAAQVMLKRITGINPDLHGQDAGRAEPGVVVRLRQQQGLVILKPLFRAYKNMRKAIVKRLTSIILEYMPVSQMQEIVGQDEVYDIVPDQETGVPMVMHKESGEMVPLADVKNLQYHLELEETSNSATQRMFELSSYLEMQQTGFPVDPLAILDKMDLSLSDRERWGAYITGIQEAESTAQNNQFELENKKIELQHERELERLRLQHEQAMGKLMLQAERDEDNDQNTDAKNRVDLIDAVLRYRSEMARAQAQSEQTHIKAATDLSKEVIKAEASKAKEGEKNGTSEGRSSTGK